MTTVQLLGGPWDGLEVTLSDSVPVPPELRFPERGDVPVGPLTPKDRAFYDHVRPEAPE